MFCHLSSDPPVCPQVLEQLRNNRANLKPPQLQMLEQLESQLAVMQQHQVSKERTEDLLSRTRLYSFSPFYVSYR